MLVFTLFASVGLGFAWSELQFWTFSWQTVSASAVVVPGKCLHSELGKAAD